MRGIVERLKWRNLPVVEHAPGDARRMIVLLAPAGQAMIEQTVRFARQIAERTVGNLDTSWRNAINNRLRKIGGSAPR